MFDSYAQLTGRGLVEAAAHRPGGLQVHTAVSLVVLQTPGASGARRVCAVCSPADPGGGHVMKWGKGCSWDELCSLLTHWSAFLSWAVQLHTTCDYGLHRTSREVAEIDNFPTVAVGPSVMLCSALCDQVRFSMMWVPENVHPFHLSPTWSGVLPVQQTRRRANGHPEALQLGVCYISLWQFHTGVIHVMNNICNVHPKKKREQIPAMNWTLKVF